MKIVLNFVPRFAQCRFVPYSKYNGGAIKFTVKLYVKLLSLTLALLYVFVTGYLSGIFASEEALASVISSMNIRFLPEPRVFEWIWSAVFLCETLALTVTFADKKLRKCTVLWITSGALKIAAAYALFAARLFAFAFTLILTAFIVCMKLTLFYLDRSPALLLPVASIAVWYAVLSALSFALLY